MTAVCSPCRTEQGRWLDTKPSTHVTSGITFQSHASYDDTPAGIRDNNAARYQSWVGLVRTQQALIARICADEGHAATVVALPAARADVEAVSGVAA